ncbi:hypothetical protein E0I61_15840 [Flavobacterium ranwuense]|uniref:Uncharacterized protein n=1 Tax=Flavobacterium ranwuense TaxID=2541725 RepID=A0ABY2DMS5_9FLAO|nr:hypothetical protein [Flavobacterium ranwuense]TDE26945.1 hypothetical protein E0I61_15840 [Flavobacterium ranwuense]
MEDFYTNHQGLLEFIGLILGIFAIYISIIQPILSFTKAQKKANKDKRFETYHNLIDHFAGANGGTKLDRQIAIAFELRRFPEYHPVTKRILKDWINKHDESTESVIKRLVKEMQLTVNYIEASYFERRFNFRKK